MSAPRRLPVLLFMSLACGGGTDEHPSGDLPEVSAARLKEHISYLASDRLAGRGTGTPATTQPRTMSPSASPSSAWTPPGPAGTSSPSLFATRAPSREAPWFSSDDRDVERSRRTETMYPCPTSSRPGRR